MKNVYSPEIIPEESLLATAQGRQHVLGAVLRLTKGTSLEPQAYEQQLLGRFVQGDLTIDQVVALLEAHETLA